MLFSGAYAKAEHWGSLPVGVCLYLPIPEAAVWSLTNGPEANGYKCFSFRCTMPWLLVKDQTTAAVGVCFFFAPVGIRLLPPIPEAAVWSLTNGPEVNGYEGFSFRCTMPWLLVGDQITAAVGVCFFSGAYGIAVHWGSPPVGVCLHLPIP